MLSIVIPSYNRKDCVLRLLADLRQQEGAEFEVIVVDDQSPDDTVEAIRREFPEVTLLVNEENGGPCVSRNRGVRAAKGEIIVGFDSDVSLPDPRLLAKVEAAFRDEPETTGFAFRIFEPDGVSDDAPRWWHPVPIDQGRERTFETDYFSGTACAFRREAMIEAGLYPEYLYMHYEEVELAWRILDHGGTLRYRPELTAVHHANPVSRRSEIEVYYKPRNQVLLALSCLPPARLVSFVLPRVAYQMGTSIRNGHFSDFLRAMREAARRGRDVLEHRKALTPATCGRLSALRKG